MVCRAKPISRLIAVFLFFSVLVAAAQQIRHDSVSTISRYGNTSSEVAEIQKSLIAKGYLKGSADGTFGYQTLSALRAFQRDYGLYADGVAGEKTLAALGIASSVSRILKYGSTGADVKLLQRKLIEQRFLWGKADGSYGYMTVNAVKYMQSKYGLSVDGVAGASTLQALKILKPGSLQNSVPVAAASGGYRVSATATEKALLARIISAEARGEPYSGQVAVGAVILNRVKHPSFPNTLSGVIYQRGAFTAIVDGQFHEAVEPSANRAADDALKGWDPSGGAIYYYNPARTTNKWIWSRTVITIIGKHRFCM